MKIKIYKKSMLLLLMLSANLFASKLNWPVPSQQEKDFDSFLKEFSNSLSFSTLINPTPESQEKQKNIFFAKLKANEIYNPIFSYKPLSKKALDLKLKANDFKLNETNSYANFLIETKELLLNKMEILKTRGTFEFSGKSQKLYFLPTQQEINQAQEILNKLGWQKEVEEKNLTDKELALILKNELLNMGLKDWGVRISANMTASASVSPASKKVNIKKGRKFSQKDAVRLIEHEIKVHALRAQYGHSMPLNIFTIGLEGYLETEEGMAAYNEVKHGINDGLRLFAIRVLAVDMAEKMSFYEVFKNLVKKGISDSDAWDITIRVKRGLTDTTEKGAYGKDISYFRGYMKVKKFMENGGEWNKLMRYGKVSIDNIQEIDNVLQK